MDAKDIEKEIKQIKTRNARVELDKKWETSWTRKLCICVLTYIALSRFCQEYLGAQNQQIKRHARIMAHGIL